MPDPARHDEQFFDLPPEENMPGEHLDSQVQKAQEQIHALKRQQESLERQKRELEELSRRQDQLQAGKSDMIEKFTRSLVVLERETYDAQKRVEQLHAVHDSFHQHLDVLEGINPKEWEGLDIQKELTKALSAVDDARAEFNRSLPKISPDSSDAADPVAPTAGYQMDYTTEGSKDFAYWLKAGAAFTLPLIVVAIIFAMVFLSMLPR